MPNDYCGLHGNLTIRKEERNKEKGNIFKYREGMN